MMRSGRLPVGLVACALWLGPDGARANPASVERAIEMYRQGALTDALSAFQQALEAGGNGRSGLVIIYDYLGVLRAGARDREGAVAAFRAALSLDPDFRPTAEPSPHVREAFEAALVRRGSAGPLACAPRVTGPVDAGGSVSLRVGVRGDPVGLAGAVRVEQNGRQVASVRGTTPFELQVPRPQGAHGAGLTVVLLDRFGSTLDTVRLGTDAEGAGPSGSRSGSQGSLLSSPWFWTAAAVLVAGGLVTGLLVAGQDDRARFGEIEVYP